ncbi:phosphoribosylformylglycinamidine cyclo-ligase [Eubacteriaceae bacterium ES2]|nr:phosphoribosylformylglycinamidine cyclo-ligase [Eubacteriaceae bacterium ES2]
MDQKTQAYRSAGVDVEAGYESVKLMKEDVQRTFNKQVLSHLGGFGGLFELPEGYQKPVLVSGTDGVGTKLKLAFMMDKHDTIGIDCVAMCVNDILCQGAEPLFFLDYIACGKNYPQKIAAIVKGISQGCIQGNMALIGGETAEMPGMYDENEYDLAGFAVGVVEKDQIITGQNIQQGNVLIGLPSSGVHSNGFSLVRKVLFNDLNLDVNNHIDDLGMKLGEALLTPTRIYVKAVNQLLNSFSINGMCHVTGGGFYENIPRMIPDGLCAKIDIKAINTVPIFEFIQNAGKISNDAMFATFNMGIGLVLAVPEHKTSQILETLTKNGEKAVVLGEIIAGDKKICL